MLGLKVTSPIDTLDRQTYPHLSSPLSSIPLSRPSIQPFSIYSYHITSSPVLPSLSCPVLFCPALFCPVHPSIQCIRLWRCSRHRNGQHNRSESCRIPLHFRPPLVILPLSFVTHLPPPLLSLHPSIIAYLTISYLTIPHLTLPYLILSYLTLSYHTLPYFSLPYLTSPHLCFYRQYDVIYFSRSPLLSLKLIFSLLTDLPSISMSISNFFSVISR